MENFEKSSVEMSDEEIITPRNRRKRSRRDFQQADDTFLGATIGDNPDLVKTLENLETKPEPAPERPVLEPKGKIEPNPVPPQSKRILDDPKLKGLLNKLGEAGSSVEGNEQRENPITILEGINKEASIEGILNLVKKAYKNETTDEARSYYTIVLNTLQQIQKTADNPDKKNTNKLLNKLPEMYDLRETVTKILNFNTQTELTPAEVKERSIPEVKNTKQDKESPEGNTDTEYLKSRIDEARDFINRSADNMSVRALMTEFALDEETAKGYLIRALGVKEENRIGDEEAVTIKNSLKSSLLNTLKSKLAVKAPKEESVKEEKGEIEEVVVVKEVEKNTEKEEEAKEKEKIILNDEQIAKVKSAFDTPGFLEFLAENPDRKFDIENTDNTEKILKMHEAFLVKEQVSQGLKRVIIEGLNDVVGVGDSESVSCLDDYLTAKNYEDPEVLMRYQFELSLLDFGELEISRLQEKIKTETANLPLGRVTTAEETDLETINTRYDSRFIGPVGRKIISQFAKTGEMIGLKKEDSKFDYKERPKYLRAALKLLFADFPYALYQLTRINSAENKKARDEARAKIEKITGEKYSKKSTGKFLEKMLEQRAKSEQIGKIEDDINSNTHIYKIFKERLANTLMKIEGVAEGAGKTIKKTIANVLSGENVDLSSTEKAQALLEKTREAIEQGSELSFLSDDDLLTLQIEIDKRAQEIVIEEVRKAFELNKKTKGPFSNIENTLKGILDKTKIGSKEGEEVRKTIKEALVEVAKKCNDPVITIRVKAFILTNKL